MRPHNQAFVRAAVRHFDCPAPVFEFGALQVEDYGVDLRGLFGDRAYVGCDVRPGPGVDRIEDVSRSSAGAGTVGTVLCIETFEHVFDIQRAFDEVFRMLRPGGVFVITCPFHFHIHAYPDDYWRLTPACLRRQLEPYAARIVGFQGHAPTPHTVMGVAVKCPAPPDFAARAERLIGSYRAWLRQQEGGGPVRHIGGALGGLFRSRAERQQMRAYHRAEFQVDITPVGRPEGECAPAH